MWNSNFVCQISFWIMIIIIIIIIIILFDKG